MTYKQPERGDAANLRTWIYGNVFIGGLERVALALHHLPANKPERHDIELISDVRYQPGDEPAHQLDIYRPRNARSPLPVAVYIHGGGFKYFSRKTHWAMAMVLAKAGFLVFNIDYRLAPAHPFPAAVQDISHAWRWLAANLESYGGDRGRVVCAGESAGANLSLGLSIASCWQHPEPWARRIWQTDLRPHVLLPACGYLQVSHPERHVRERQIPAWMQARIHLVSHDWLPDHPAMRPENAWADPLVLLEQAGPPERPLPATFAIVGDRDPVVGDTLRLGPALERLGVQHDVKVYPGGVHAFHAFRITAQARQAWDDQLGFVAAHLPAAAPLADADHDG